MTFDDVPDPVAGEVIVSMPGGVLFDSCGDYGFTYSAPLAPGGYWVMDLSLIGPDGIEAASAYTYAEAPSGADSFFLCESPNP